MLTVKRDRDGKFQKCKARWVLRDFKIDKKMLNKLIALRQHDQDFDFSAKMQLPMVGLSDTLTSRLRSVSYTDVKKKKVKQVAPLSLSSRQDILLMRSLTMRSMMTSCSSSWRLMSMTNSGCGHQKQKRGLPDCEEDFTCMEKGDHAQDCGCGLEHGDTGEVHWRQDWGNLKEKIENGPKKVRPLWSTSMWRAIWIPSWTTS